jgi:VWFA-related protein
MRQLGSRHTVAAFAIAGVAALLLAHTALSGQEAFRFRTGVELINVTATVTDSSGRFVPGLTLADFVVYEDDSPVEVTHFSAERVPVSLGIVLDTSGSMLGAKISAARVALDRFLFDLLGPDDEVFLYRFDHAPRLVQGWTTDRSLISSELGRIRPDGATSLFDAVAEALPLLKTGRHRKKALLVISDGNDTSSHTDLPTLKQLIRQSEAIVYAIGMDAQTTLPPFDGNEALRRQFPTFNVQLPDSETSDSPEFEPVRYQRRGPVPRPFPTPGSPMPPRIPGIPPRTSPPRTPRTLPPRDPGDSGNTTVRTASDRVNVASLRDITDDSGGRTEVLRDPKELDLATARIADELSKQYYLGYPRPGHSDGSWHTIRVEVRDKTLRVRARRGYVADIRG